MAILQKIKPCLWFDTQAEEAVKFYTSVFKNSSTGQISRYTKAGYETHRMPEGQVLTIEFTLEGQNFVALNGGPNFKFNEAVSLIIRCETQDEIDYYWNKLKEGGDEKAQVCGWLKDKFGLSWQVTPIFMENAFVDYKSEKSQRVMEAMLKMKKLNIEKLQEAFNG
jgi:predicted 3-demethylubiquinone-9 3-methyltransferase (glyoxalase superfamily)